jgi:N-acyl-D-aspartate/D-glutamate deacylase
VAGTKRFDLVIQNGAVATETGVVHPCDMGIAEGRIVALGKGLGLGHKTACSVSP